VEVQVDPYGAAAEHEQQHQQDELQLAAQAAGPPVRPIARAAGEEAGRCPTQGTAPRIVPGIPVIREGPVGAMAVAVAAEVAVGVVAAGREPGVVLAPEAFGVPGAPVGAGLVGGGVAAARGPCGTGGAAVLCAPGADAFVDALLGAGTFVAALPFADGVPILQGGQGTATGNVIAVGAAPQRFPGRRPTARRGV